MLPAWRDESHIAGILPRGFSVRAVEFRNGQREVTARALPGCVRTNMRSVSLLLAQPPMQEVPVPTAHMCDAPLLLWPPLQHYCGAQPFYGHPLPGFSVWCRCPCPPPAAPAAGGVLGSPALPAPSIALTAVCCHLSRETRFRAPQLHLHSQAGSEGRGSVQPQLQWSRSPSSVPPPPSSRWHRG